MKKKDLRVLVFGSTPMHLDIEAIAKSLSSYAIVREVNWQYKLLPKRTRYIFLRLFYRSFESIYWSLRIFKEIHVFHADVVFSTYAYSTGLIGMLAATLSKKPCVIHAVGSDLRLDSRSFLGKVFVPLTLKTVSGVICVSKDLESRAKVFGAKNTVVIPPPLDLKDFEEKDFRRNDKEVISIAHLNPIKGMSYLIKAMKRIEEGKLIIIGNGPEREKLELLSLDLGLSDRVFFLGWVNHSSEFWDYLMKATVFVLPSISEGLPKVLVEAMVAGLPIIATKVGGIPELIKDGINGLIVPPKNEMALAEALKKIFDDDHFRNNASNENKKIAQEYAAPIIGLRMYNYLNKISMKM
ncbi:MAG: glycosyltransferase [Candidatus Hodarchaeota archaeon]